MRRKSFLSLAASWFLHAACGAAVWLLGGAAPPGLNLSLSSHAIVRIAGLTVPRSFFREKPPSRPPAARLPRPAVSRPPQDPKSVSGRRFVPLPSSRTPPVAPAHLLAAAPELRVQPERRLLLLPAEPQLGPAPVRTGEFQEAQLGHANPLDPGAGSRVAAAGFGEFPRASASPSAGPVSAGSFGDASVSTQATPPLQSVAGDSGFNAVAAAREGPAPLENPKAARKATPVEIQFKPVPDYTEEARRRRIEGEVLLEMLFMASGEARLLRVVRGLGYGLDEAAERAAKQVRFIPARRDGSPVDSRAIVHIQFQLAY